jgi:hypothetical protein
MVGTVVSWYIRDIFEEWKEDRQGKGILAIYQASRRRDKAGMIISAIIGTLFALARLVITIESFISLRPAGVYATVAWTDLVPHF